jgi:hypothetical protein
VVEVAGFAGLQGRRQRGGRLGFGSHHPHVGAQRLDDCSHSGNQAAPADGGDDGIDRGQVLEDLEGQRRIPRDEVVVVERMHQPSLHAG